MQISTPTRQSVLRALLEASPLPMLVGSAQPKMRLLAVNQRFTRLFGYRRADLDTAESWWSLAFPDAIYRANVLASWSVALERATRLGAGPAEAIEARVTCRDRSSKRVAFYIGLYRGYVFVLCNDLTAQRRAEAELREAREFLQRVVDTSPHMIFVVDEKGRVVFVNRWMAEYYQARPEALLSRATEDVHADMEQADAYVQDDLEVMRTGKTLIKQETNTAPSGQVHWFHTIKVPLPRPDGRVHCLGIATDITAQKQAEQARRELEAGMWRSQKLESLGVLAGGLAHDFNNLLASIRTNAHLAIARLPEGSSAQPFMESIGRATQQAADLTRQLLMYGGQSQPSLEALRLEDLASEMKALLQAGVSKKIAFQLELEPAPVEADPTQLRQVLMNVIVNASDAMEPRPGRLWIRTGVRELPGTQKATFVGDVPAPGLYSFVEIEDEGCGMPLETQARIFEPFFSTKFTGRGLGLSVVHGIVRAHRGALEIESWPGHGTRVAVLLPHTSAVPASTRPVSEPARSARGTLLVIDDEPLVRSTACVLLEDAGFRALSAIDGQDGIDVFKQHMAEIDGVVLDLTMPRLDGWQCLRALRALRPDIPVLLTSGYSARGAAPPDIVPAPAFLAKPFEPTDLLREAARLVSAGSGQTLLGAS